MNRHQTWEVRVSADVAQLLRESASRGGQSEYLPRAFRQAMKKLASHGTRGNGVKKLKSLDLWEIRVGDYRAYFCPVPGTNKLAVGVLARKRTRRHSPRTLRGFEMKTHRWRDRLGGA